MDNIPFMKPYLGNNARTCPKSTGNNPVFVHLTGRLTPELWTPIDHLTAAGLARQPGRAEISLWCDLGVECEPPGAWSLVTEGHQHHKMSCLF